MVYICHHYIILPYLYISAGLNLMNAAPTQTAHQPKVLVSDTQASCTKQPTSDKGQRSSTRQQKVPGSSSEEEKTKEQLQTKKRFVYVSWFSWDKTILWLQRCQPFQFRGRLPIFVNIFVHFDTQIWQPPYFCLVFCHWTEMWLFRKFLDFGKFC